MSNRTKMLIIACAMVIASAPRINAMHNMHCDSACASMITRQFGYVSPGVSWINIDKVNDFLATAGISPFKEVPFTVSLGGRKEMRKLILESGLTMRYWHENVNSNLRTTLMIGDITWNTGYNVLPATMKATLFPYLGIGAGLNSMRIRSDKKTLAELIASTAPDVTVWQSAFLLNAGAGTDIILSKKDPTRGMVVGVRAGYLFDPFTNDREWHANGTTVKDIPVLNQSGPYVKLILGGWGHHR